MGQYFTPYLKDQNEKVTLVGQHIEFERLYKKEKDRVKAFEYFTGAKLTEHSWLGCSLTNAVSSMLYKKPCVVAWIGDYSDEDKLCNKKKKSFTEKQAGFDVSDKCCVNHSKKEWFAFSKLPVAEVWTLDDGRKQEEKMYPLSLLTACGNGQGGGDYYGRNQDKIGTWAFNLIEIADYPPEGYKEVFPDFKED